MSGNASASDLQDGGEFRIETEQLAPDMYLIAPRGQADLHTAPALRERLSEAIESRGEGRRRRPQRSDLRRLDDARGICSAQSSVYGNEGELRIIVDDPHVRRVFEITLLDRVFDLYAER